MKERFNISDEERINSERLAATQRGSVRIACGVYFTTTEYEKYRRKFQQLNYHEKNSINDNWEILCKIHILTKHYTLLAEEYNISTRAFYNQ